MELMINPHNKRLRIRLLEETQSEQSIFFIPDEAKEKSEWTFGTVISVSEKELEKFHGKTVVFPTNMIETVPIEGRDYHFIQANYIVAYYG